MYKKDLDLQWLICYKTKPNQTKPNQTNPSIGQIDMRKIIPLRSNRVYP